MNVKRLVPVAAVIAATLASPTAAAADPLCYSVGYTVLGTSSDVTKCVQSGWESSTVSAGPWAGNFGQARVSADIPFPVRQSMATGSAAPALNVASTALGETTRSTGELFIRAI